jgi:P27 family predicted phage terminase small subunit
MKNAPQHLQPETRAWFDAVVETYTLEPHHVRLLQLAAEAWDRAQEARAAIAKDGITVYGREGGMKTHPAVAVERDSANRFATLLKQLNLDVETPADLGRPPESLKFANPWSESNGTD